MRDTVLVSHANPEDNEFTRWLVLRLAAAGYPVWCDLTKLLGGEEDFWNDIQKVLRERVIKFVFVLSRSSNTKQGTIRELDLATKVARSQELKDFIIPVWIDDLPASDFDIRIGTINAVRFQEGWARGFDQLLKKLEHDQVPTKPEFNRGLVSSWWRQHVSAGLGVKDEPETLVTNWYPMAPTDLYFHELGREGIGPVEVGSRLPYPAVVNNQYLVSFAPATAFEGQLGPSIVIRSSEARRVGDSDPGGPRLWTFGEERRGMANLLRQAWLALIGSRQLPQYEFANNSVAFYFKKDMLPDDRAYFIDSMGNRSWRAVVGYKTVKRSEQIGENLRYWHFALEAKPTTTPIMGYTMKPRVLFSDDGLTIWDSKTRLHRARRSQCRGWWNDRWRDLILGGVAYLGDENGVVNFPVGPEQMLCVPARPLTLTSPVSYVESQSPVEDELFLSNDADEDEEFIGDEENEVVDSPTQAVDG